VSKHDSDRLKIRRDSCDESGSVSNATESVIAIYNVFQPLPKLLAVKLANVIFPEHIENLKHSKDSRKSMLYKFLCVKVFM
jgi:hypothetical protein